LESEEAKFAYERERDYKTLLEDEKVRSFLVELKPVQNRNLERRWSGLQKESVVSETQGAGFPDFIARKGKDIYAIEVKNWERISSCQSVRGSSVSEEARAETVCSSYEDRYRNRRCYPYENGTVSKKAWIVTLTSIANQ
jgi:hypothetical protein